jgi:hypothetical protein
VIDQVLGFKIVGVGRRPMLIQRRAYRLISLLQLRFCFHVQAPFPRAMKPGISVFTT